MSPMKQQGAPGLVTNVTVCELENGGFRVDFPSKNGDFPLLCYIMRGYVRKPLEMPLQS